MGFEYRIEASSHFEYAGCSLAKVDGKHCSKRACRISLPDHRRQCSLILSSPAGAKTVTCGKLAVQSRRNANGDCDANGPPPDGSFSFFLHNGGARFPAGPGRCRALWAYFFTSSIPRSIRSLLVHRARAAGQPSGQTSCMSRRRDRHCHRPDTFAQLPDATFEVTAVFRCLIEPAELAIILFQKVIRNGQQPVGGALVIAPVPSLAEQLTSACSSRALSIAAGARQAVRLENPVRLRGRLFPDRLRVQEGGQ